MIARIFVLLTCLLCWAWLAAVGVLTLAGSFRPGELTSPALPARFLAAALLAINHRVRWTILMSVFCSVTAHTSTMFRAIRRQWISILASGRRLWPAAALLKTRDLYPER